jgi:hypothetical protein
MVEHMLGHFTAIDYPELVGGKVLFTPFKPVATNQP